MATKPRLRDLGICLGRLPTGRYNAITDVPGVRVGHCTVIRDAPHVARTGVTIIAPRLGAVRDDPVFAGYHSFNGCGEVTGLLWVEESGRLTSEIALTGTTSIGAVHEALISAVHTNGHGGYLPVVGETFDGFLNTSWEFHVREEHVHAAIDAAGDGPVAEGNVGGGTGMMCHDFKGGIGTASRVATLEAASYTVGVLVQANHGDRQDLRIDGVPVGQEIGPDHTPLPNRAPLGQIQAPASSILVVLATDAPLLPFQCKRLAQRATIGLGRTGSYGQNGSGDIFLAFSTANHAPTGGAQPIEVWSLPNEQMDPLFLAAAEAVEEAIANALCAAETLTGRDGSVAHALPHDKLVQVMQRYGRVQR